MTQTPSTGNGDHLGQTDKDKKMIKTYSFNSDSDNSIVVTHLKPVSNSDKLNSLHSPSIDSVNNDDDLSEGGTKVKKRKSRRKTEEYNSAVTPSPIKKPSWYQRIDWTKPLMVLGMIVLLYIMWIERGVWIPRLLTSNSRIRRVAIVTEDSSIPSISDGASVEPPEEDPIENNDTPSDNEEKTISSSKTKSAEKINIRPVGRNKMKFNQDNPREKVRKTDTEDRSIDTTEPIILPPSSSKKHRHHRSSTVKNSVPSNQNLRVFNYDDIIDQLRKNLKSQSRDKDFLSTLSKTTGLNKEKLHRFLYKKDYRLLTVQTFLSLLEKFDLMLLIVPK